MDSVSIKISAKSVRQLFKGCTQEYITKVCKGKCCEGSGELSVAISEREKNGIEELGAEVKGGLIVADKRGKCPFKRPDGLCGLHGTVRKPIGCRASPFTLNKNNTLIVRNRYRLMRCYKGGTVPAYKAYSESLVALFGSDIAAEITTHLDGGGGDIVKEMPMYVYQSLAENAIVRKGI